MAGQAWWFQLDQGPRTHAHAADGRRARRPVPRRARSRRAGVAGRHDGAADGPPPLPARSRARVGRALRRLQLDSLAGRTVGRRRARLDLRDEVRSIFEDDDGRVWLGTQATGVLRLDFGDARSVRATHAPADGRALRRGARAAAGCSSPCSRWARPRTSLGVDGFYRFDEARTRFVKDDTLDAGRHEGPRLRRRRPRGRRARARVREPRAASPAVATRQADGTWRSTGQLRAVRRLRRRRDVPDDDGVVWFGGGEGILRYDGRVAQPAGRRVPGAAARREHLVAGHT
jgi:hypothetical protein